MSRSRLTAADRELVLDALEHFVAYHVDNGSHRCLECQMAIGLYIRLGGDDALTKRRYTLPLENRT